MFRHETGELVRDRNGQAVPRPPSSKPPCMGAINAPVEVRERVCAKISPESGIDLSPRNVEAYAHYKECRAVGQFENDPIVRQNAAIIQQLEESHHRIRLESALVRGRFS